MKKYVYLLSVSLIIGGGCMAQKVENARIKTAVPKAAQDALLKSFPGCSRIRWEKEDANFEAEFKQDGKTMSAEFSPQGSLLESEVTIKAGALPPLVLAYLKAHYSGAVIKEAAKITRANGEVNYEAEINKMDLIFNSDGKFIKKEQD